MLFTTLAVIAVMQSGSAGAAFADTPHTRVETYPVAGSNLDEVRQAIAEGRPTDEQGRRYDALTRWRYRYDFFHDGQGRCLPETAEVEVQVTVILPELADRSTLSAEELRRWDVYAARLDEHEAGHVRMALEGVETMQRAVRGARDCAGMEAAARRVKDRVNAANSRYDLATRHGLMGPPPWR